MQRNLSDGTLPCLSIESLIAPNSGLSQNSGLEKNPVRESSEHIPSTKYFRYAKMKASAHLRSIYFYLCKGH